MQSVKVVCCLYVCNVRSKCCVGECSLCLLAVASLVGSKVEHVVLAFLGVGECQDTGSRDGDDLLASASEHDKKCVYV